MRATNFSMKSGIYFVVGGAQLDMHNDYDFTAFSYDVPTRSLLLTWRRRTIGEPTEVTLAVRDVTRLEVEPRRADLPFSEDDCLNGVAYVCDEDWGRGGFLTAGEPDDSWRWSFDFMSGAAIVVAAGTATLHLGPRAAEPRR